MTAAYFTLLGSLNQARHLIKALLCRTGVTGVDPEQALVQQHGQLPAADARVPTGSVEADPA